VHFIAMTPRHQRPVLEKYKLYESGRLDPPDLVDVAKAFGDQQCGLAPVQPRGSR
jgi:hypothetical protein